MIRHLCVIVPCVIATGLLAADLPEKWSKRLESTEANYQQAVLKADNVRFYAVQKAAQERLKSLKSALTDATKAGEFDAATELKARVATAESEGGLRQKPKNIAKHGSHEYALINEPTTWHLAKQHCEELGGHLAIINTPQEAQFLASLCGKAAAWVGASDERSEGHWKWVNETAVAHEILGTWNLDNGDESQHSLAFWPPSGRWEDGSSGHRYAFICEWDN